MVSTRNLGAFGGEEPDSHNEKPRAHMKQYLFASMTLAAFTALSGVGQAQC